MKVENTDLPGALVVTPQVFGDDRGFFMETYNFAKTAELGIPEVFVQDNHSRSSQGVLRGMHFQHPQWQGKLVRVISGEVYDVAVDMRSDSDTFGKWFGIYLNDENNKQLYLPAGFAHGFCVTSEIADVAYKCTSDYQPNQDNGFAWNDPEVGIEWPIKNPILSKKDMNLPSFCSLPSISIEKSSYA